MSEKGAQFYDRNGNHLFHVGLPDFFLEPPLAEVPETGPRGPRIMFDGLHGRWVAAEVTHPELASGIGHLYIAITKTNDALGDWWVYRFNFTSKVLRNPAIGISSNKVAIGFDHGPDRRSAELGSSVLVVNSADLYAAVPTLNASSSPLSATVHGWRPAIDRSSSPDLFAVGWSSIASPGHLMDLRITDR